MKTILVPTDFSEHALFALKVAANIAFKIKAKIELVHVYDLPSSGVGQYQYYFDKYKEEMTANANKQLDKLLNLKFLKGITINKNIIADKLMWEAISDNKFKDADLIVLGSHGTSGFNNVFIGSNTEKIVRLANAPVLTIKDEITEFTIKKMVFASNFFDESYQVFEKIKFFADLYNAHIDLLKVITPKHFEQTTQSQKLMEKFSDKFNLKNYSIHIYNAHNIEKGIIDFSNEKDADLIAIETHGRTGFAHLINGSLAESIVKHETKPVLSIKIPELSINLSRYMETGIPIYNIGNI